MNRTHQILLFLLVALFSLIFFWDPGTPDVDIWLARIQLAETVGPVRGFVAAQADYPPLSTILLYLVSKSSHSLGVTPVVALKGLLFLSLFAASAIFQAWSRDPIITVMFHLSLLPNVALGYLDALFAPFLVGAIYALHHRRLFWFTTLYSTSCLIKWQPLVIAPFVVAYLIYPRDPFDSRRPHSQILFKRVVLPLFAIGLGVLTVFGWREIARSLIRALTHDYVSGYAMNLGWIITYVLHVVLPQKFGPLQGGYATLISFHSISVHNLRVLTSAKIVFVVAYIATLLQTRRARSFEGFVLLSLSGYLTYCILNVGVEENHFFMLSILSSAWWVLRKRGMLWFVVWSLASNANLILFYGFDGSGLPFSHFVGVDLSVCIAAANVALYVAFVVDVGGWLASLESSRCVTGERLEDRTT